MLLAFILFWLLIGWGLYDGDIYLKEASIYAATWGLCLLGFIFLPAYTIGFVIASVLLDVILVLKVIGQDIVVH